MPAIAHTVAERSTEPITPRSVRPATPGQRTMNGTRLGSSYGSPFLTMRCSPSR